MRLHLNIALLLTSVAAGLSWADSPSSLDLIVEPAAVTIEPPPEGRKLVSLPELEYRLSVVARCPDGHQPASLSVGIADTRKTLLQDALADPDPIVVEMTIPARQVAPIPVDGFCLSEQKQEMLVRDAVTAHLSLRCASDAGDAITYASQALAVTVRCAAGDQGESEPLILR